MSKRRKVTSLAAICVSISLLVFAAPVSRAAAPASPSFQSTGTLPGGGMFIARRDESSAVTAVELWFRAPAAGYDQSAPGISRLAIAAVAASAPAGGSSLAQTVTRVGGTLSLNVYPDIVMIGASVPSWQFASVLKAMTGTYYAAQITDAGYKTALRDCAIAAAESQYDPDRVLQDALFARLFSSGPAHFPPVPPSAQDFTKISLDQVKSFAARAFSRGNTILSAAGALDTTWMSGIEPQSARASGTLDKPIDSVAAASGGDVTQTASVSGLGFAWTGPPISDVREATALDFVADYLFDGDRGTLARQIHAASAGTFLNGQFITLHDPGVLIAIVSGSNAAAMRSKVLDAVTAMNTPLDAKSFAAARNAFVYHLFSQMQTPQTRADNFGWYAAEGNLPYAPGDESGTYLQAAQSLDPAYVSQVVRRYLQHPAIVELQSAHAQGSAT